MRLKLLTALGIWVVLCFLLNDPGTAYVKAFMVPGLVWLAWWYVRLVWRGVTSATRSRRET